MASWDQLSAQRREKLQSAALKRQLLDAVAPFSPYWRTRFADLGRAPGQLTSPAALRELPAVGERDLCPDGDPRGAAGLVLQTGEDGYALHAEGPKMRRALTRRLFAPRTYRAQLEAETRPTSSVFAGHGLRFPVASTRSDLDVVTRAGARLWQVLGLTSADVVVSALPHDSAALQQGLWLAALGSGSPLFAAGARAGSVAQSLALVPATVLVLPSSRAAELLARLAEREVDLSSVRTLLLAGAPDLQERADAAQALEPLAPSAVLLGVHAVEGHRLLWGECRQSGGDTGLHTYPDLEIVDVVDPETGEQTQDSGELVLTQLGLRGSALLRWRSGDLASVTTNACPGCGRTVPRVTDLARGALVPELALRAGAVSVDLRAVSSALTGRPDVSDWRVVLGRSSRDGSDQLLVHVQPDTAADPAEVAAGVARDIRLAAGLLPTQVVLAADGELPSGAGVTARILT